MFSRPTTSTGSSVSKGWQLGSAKRAGQELAWNRTRPRELLVIGCSTSPGKGSRKVSIAGGSVVNVMIDNTSTRTVGLWGRRECFYSTLRCELLKFMQIAHKCLRILELSQIQPFKGITLQAQTQVPGVLAQHSNPHSNTIQFSSEARVC